MDKKRIIFLLFILTFCQNLSAQIGTLREKDAIVIFSVPTNDLNLLYNNPNTLAIDYRYGDCLSSVSVMNNDSLLGLIQESYHESDTLFIADGFGIITSWISKESVINNRNKLNYFKSKYPLLHFSEQPDYYYQVAKIHGLFLEFDSNDISLQQHNALQDEYSAKIRSHCYYCLLKDLHSIQPLYSLYQNGEPLFDYRLIINKYDDNMCQKDSLWVVQDWSPGHDAFFSLFEGKHNGIAFSIRKATNTLDWLEYSINGDPGIIIDFANGSFIGGYNYPGCLDTFYYIRINNSSTIENKDGLLYLPRYQAYTKSYSKDFFDSPHLKSEGIIIWDINEDFRFDYNQYGEWKYYDKEGNVTVKKFSDMPESLINSSDSTFDFGQKINQYNSSGDKEGLWEEDWGPECIAYITYHNGERDGLFCAYRPSTNTFSQIGEYIAGEPRMVINMGEGDLSHRETPAGRITSFALYSTNNEFSIYTQDGSSFTPYYKRYEKNFYPNGQLKSEGFMIWDKDQDPEKDSIKVGEWKYCDADGSITIKNYQKT